MATNVNKISKDFILEYKADIHDALQKNPQRGMHPSQKRLADLARETFGYKDKTSPLVIWNAITIKFFDI